MENLHTQVESVKNDHPFFSLSNDELFEIVLKPDQWSKDDHQLALNILDERRKEVDEVTGVFNEQWLADFDKHERSHKPLIYAGYLFAILGGLIGILVGIHITTAKKTLPDAKRVLAYTIGDRQHGWQILIIGAMMFLLLILIYSIA